MKDIKALFLGPKAENQELYESLIIDIIRDSCFLRKNFHPADKTIVTETDKLQPAYRETAAQLREELNEILAELKKGVPWYHPRYIGHMFGDLMLPAVVGYFSTILYNPNNVVGEVSTATTRMELDYVDALCKMVGYRECKALSGNNAWGHLCSGGTSANIEALWVARNMKYYPVTLKLLTREFPFLDDVLINYFKADIKDLSCSQLFNLPPQEILDIRHFVELRCQQNGLDYTFFEKRVAELAVRTLGMHAFHKLVSEKLNEDLPLPLVYISKSSHYSWEKSMDILGLGQAQLVKVNMDSGYRLEIDDLHKKFNHETPTLAIIGILGSSKQGSIDPIDDIIRFRAQMEQQHKHSFFVHIDAAYGGYFCSVLKDENSNASHFLSKKEVLSFINPGNDLFEGTGMDSTLNGKWYDKIASVAQADSITIDPHKMGYIPYPAGSILFKDTRVKEFISYLPSYLNKPADENDLGTAFLGQWTLEGSRPGAVASSCYLTNKVMPLNREAHGKLIKNSVLAAGRFWNNIRSFNNDPHLNNGYKIVPSYVPETNIVSYLLAYPGVIKTTRHLNVLTKGLFEKFTIKGDTVIPAQNFMVAKESFDYEDIPGGTLLRECGIDESLAENREEPVTIISSVFMNPLTIYLDEEFYLDFFAEMITHARTILSEIMLQIVSEQKNGERIKILWVEDDPAVNRMKQLLMYSPGIGRFLDINFVMPNVNDVEKAMNAFYDVYIFDLNLQDRHHEVYDRQKIDMAIGLINRLSNEKHKKILFYSQFFSNDQRKQQVVSDLKQVLQVDDNQMIAKSSAAADNINKDIELIIKGIFRVLN